MVGRFEMVRKRYPKRPRELRLMCMEMVEQRWRPRWRRQESQYWQGRRLGRRPLCTGLFDTVYRTPTKGAARNISYLNGSAGRGVV